MCRLLERFLGTQDFEVSAKQSVREAMSAVRDQKFDAYILDYRLGDGDGLEVAAQIRRTGSNAPIVLISGYGSEELLPKAKIAQVSDFLQKPFTLDALFEKLYRALSPAEAVEVPAPDILAKPGRQLSV